MPKLEYVPKNFIPVQMDMIRHANRIITQFRAQGFDLTLRQIYYQFVAADLFPDSRKWANVNGKWKKDDAGTKNAEPNYDWLGTIISDARRAGLIDWDAIVDRTRFVRHPSQWDSPAEIVEACSTQYDIDWWKHQPTRVEVWVEKDALVGVIEAACEPWRCPYSSTRGYISDSEIWKSAQRLKRQIDATGQDIVILHLGDHDPSGLDMSRDIQDRVSMFSGMENGEIEVRRIALTMAQVREVDPPPNPAKMTDSRYQKYADEHGDESWELDALDPTYLATLISQHIEELLDFEAWGESEKKRDAGREKLVEVAKRLEDEESEE